MAGRKVRRGEIYYADLRPVTGSEQGGIRPVVILQNDTGNRFSPTTIAAAITSRDEKHQLPTHIWIGSRFLRTASGFHDPAGAGPDPGPEKAA